MTTVREVFGAAGLAPEGLVRWGTQIPLTSPGVYVVASTSDVDAIESDRQLTIDLDAVQRLLTMRPEITVDGVHPTIQVLEERLRSMLMPTEVVLYIGLAGTSVGHRVKQYYSTLLGARAPHAGGWPLKTLAELPELWVHYTACLEPGAAEIDMVAAFAAGVPREIALHSVDPLCPIPFANLQFPRGAKKRDGIRGAKEPRVSSPASSSMLPVPPPSATSVRSAAAASQPGGAYTQVVTEKDLAGGRIRVPTSAKRRFPRARSTVEVKLRGEQLSCRWDPRMGPDKERSGLLSVPTATLQRLVRANERLAITSVEFNITLD